MNEGLFTKYVRVLEVKNKKKKEVLKLLQEIVGILFLEEEVEINKKVISFTISSVKKSILLQKNIKLKLQEKGYSIKI